MSLPQIADGEDTLLAHEAPEEFEPSEVTAPTRVGRYELVYELGSGGMATVFLARADGPGGFRKWFAIKRIHPHLSKEKRFVDMFLDEARISATLGHPNIAPVFELGADDGEYFIAMDYLHGEHLGSLATRGARELGRLPASLAAHIAARAADGLHHAHEARGEGGAPLHLVHRDVSPQNIFVTYDGTVRITDFGIAKAANRITQTETGSRKGKLAYMAPEHVLDTGVDRRADIFALGVVLWELTVGRRLFKRQNDAATILAITSGEVTRPSNFVLDYPAELEEIVLRALAREPDDRYPSAAAMARDLDRFVAGAGEPAGAAEVGSLMRSLFTDRIAQKDSLLSNRETRTSFPAPSVEGAEPSRSSVVQRGEYTRSAIPSSRAPLWAAVLGGALLLGAGGAVVTALSSPVARPGAVHIRSTPSGAQVSVDNRHRGTTPLRVDDLDVGRHRIAVALEGHRSVRAQFDVENERVELDYRLAASASSAPPPAPAEAPAPAETPEEALPEGPSESPAAARVSPPTRSPTARRDRPRQPPARAEPAEPGYLNLITNPSAEVRINGRSLGWTPLVRREFPPGVLRVQLRPAGASEWRTVRIRIESGRATPHHETF